MEVALIGNALEVSGALGAVSYMDTNDDDRMHTRPLELQKHDN